MTPKDYLTNKNFCPIPWTGLMYNFDGTVKNCIRSAAPIGNIHHDSIDSIVTGVENVTTKTRMLSNQPGENCHPCYTLEQNQNSFEIISDRVFYLRELKTVPITIYNQPTNFDLQKIDARWSNLCNFSCVYCGPEFSSKWADEIGIKIKTPTEQQQEQFENYIFSKASQLKHVYLAGGEPLLMKQNLQLLDLVNKDVSIRVNTNLSLVDSNVFEKICSFQNVHWIVSVETIEDEYEYIRYGGKWTNFVNNLNVIKNLGHKISFNMLYFALNSTSIFNCIDFLQGMGFHNNSFVVGALLKPEALNIRQLPGSMLQLARKELMSRIDQKPGYLLENGYRNVLTYLDEPFDKNTSQLFDYLKNLDARRNNDSSKIFKDLYLLND